MICAIGWLCLGMRNRRAGLPAHSTAVSCWILIGLDGRPGIWQDLRKKQLLLRQVVLPCDGCLGSTNLLRACFSKGCWLLDREGSLSGGCDRECCNFSQQETLHSPVRSAARVSFGLDSVTLFLCIGPSVNTFGSMCTLVT